MTAIHIRNADIGLMGSEASIYAYNEGANDYVVNFAQLTQRAGNFLVAREEIPDFHWTDLKDKKVLGGRKGGMPEMVFEYILRQNGIDPSKDLIIDQSIVLALQQQHLQKERLILQLSSNQEPQIWKKRKRDM